MDGSAPLLVDTSKLKTLRRKAGLSQEALADACKQQRICISIATIKRAEAGRSVAPRTLAGLAKFYAVSVESLLSEPETPAEPIQYKRACLVLVVKFSTQQQKEYLLHAIDRASPVVLDQHSGYLLAGFRRSMMPDVSHLDAEAAEGNEAADGELNQTFELLNQLQRIMRYASVVSPVFSFMTFACLNESAEGFEADHALLNQLTEKMRLLPGNQLVCSDEFRQLYEIAFQFTPAPVASTSLYWVIEPGLKPPAQLPAFHGADAELAQIAGMQQQVMSDHHAATVLIRAAMGAGKTHLLRLLYRQADSPCVPFYTDLQMKRASLAETLEEVQRGLMHSLPGRMVLLCVDNLHCATGEEYIRLASFQREYLHYPVLIVASLDQSSAPESMGRLLCDLSLQLSPLNEADCHRLGCYFTDIAETDRRDAIQRCGGNPLSLRLLLGQPGGVAHSAPTVLKWRLVQQFERLPAEEREVISWLAMAGRTLTRTQLEMLRGRPLPSSVTSAFQYVSQPSEDLLALNLPLMGDAVVDELTAGVRRSGHRQLAELAEQSNEPPSLALSQWIARQYELAAQPAAQLRHLSAAISQLIQSGAYEKAERAVNQALEIHSEWMLAESQAAAAEDTAVVALRLELLTHQVNICKGVYGWDSPVVTDLYQQIQTLSEQTGDIRYRVAGLFGIWSITLIRLELPRAMDVAGEALALAREHDDIPGQVQALSAQSNTVFWMGNMRTAFELSSKALSLCPDAGFSDPLQINGQDPRMLALCFRALSAARLELDEAPQYLDALLQAGEESAHPFSYAIAVQGAAWYFWIRREPVLTRQYARQLRELATEYHFPFYVGMAVLFEGWADYQLTGDIRHLDTVTSGFQRWLSSTAHKLLQSIYTVIAADLLIADRQPALAKELLVEAARELEAQGVHSYLPEIYRLIAQADEESAPALW